MPRLGHKKSRLGCRQCKARHVKCDELKPCSNCARHAVPCSLVTWDSSAPPPTLTSTSSSSGNAQKYADEASEDAPKPSLTSTPSPSVQNDPIPNQPKTARDESNYEMSDASSPSSQSDQFPFLTRFIHRQERVETNLWVRDLELMHHWTTETCNELSQRDDMQHLWRIVAPQRAVAHPFFMHELLAFAALHKAHMFPEQRAQYYGYGVHHQDLTIRGVRVKLRNVTAEEAPAIFATSTLLTLSVFASTGFELNYPEIHGCSNAIDGILNIFNLMQGMGNVLAIAQVHVVNSFMAPILQDPIDPIASQPMLDEVLHRLPELTSFFENKSDLSEPEKAVYLKVIANMQPCLQLAQSPYTDNRELRFLFFWPMHLQPDFLNLLRQRYPGAIVVVMFYTTMLFASQARYWFMEGWGEQLMKACVDKLGPEWHPAVQWPMSFLTPAPMWNLFQSIAQSRHGHGLVKASVGTTPFSTYSSRRPLENRSHTTASSPGSRARTTEREVETFQQHNAVPMAPHDQGVQYTKRQGPTDHAG